MHTGLAREGLIALGAVEDDSLCIRKSNGSQGRVCLPSTTSLPTGILCLNVQLWQHIPEVRMPCSIQLDIGCDKCELIDLD